MALPALLMGAGRAIASQGLKQGVKSASKNFAKDKVKDIAKKKAQSFIKNKKDDGGGGLVKRDSGDGGGSGGFFGGGGGSGGSGSGPIVQTKRIDIKKLSLIDKEETSSDQKKFDGSELIDELTKIKNNLITIKKISNSNLSRFLDAQKNRRREQEFSKRKDKEDNLEATKEKTKKPKSIKGIKGPGFLDLIKNYIANVLLGSLVNYLWKYIPQILKMFGEIADGLTNVWQRIRLAIISASVLFRRQIRFVFNLGRKILKFAAPLIKKAGSIVKKVLSFAGKRIVNLIKGAAGLALKLAKKLVPGAVKAATPIVKGAAKVAGKVVGGAVKAGSATLKAAGKAASIVNRFKFISKLFKKVPFVGALIGIGIDLAMGERLDKAIAGAAGASLGTAIGGAIGTGLIPIPVVGTWVGGAVGGAIGDWAGKAIYSKLIGLQDAADKEAPVEQRYAAGRIGQGSTSGVSRSSTSSPGTVSTINSKVPPAVEKDAKENVFKNEQSLATYKEIRSKLGSSSFVGELMQIGLDAGLGAKISKSKTDNAAKQIGSSIGSSLSDTKVFGFNKRLVGPLTQDITEWAKKAIFNDLTMISLSKYNKSEEKSDETETPSTPGTDSGGGSSGGGGGSSASYGAPEVKALLDSIAFAEGTTKSYGVISGGDVNKDLEAGKLTVQQVIDLGNTFGKPGSKHKWSGATGRYQFMPGTLNGMVQRGYLKATDLFTPQMQDKAGWQLAVNRGVTLDMLKKEGMSQNVADKLAPEWASFPYSPKGGKSYYGQGYKSLAQLKKVYDQKIGYHQDIAKKGGGAPAPDVTNKPAVSGSPKSGNDRKIFLHWTAGNYTTPFSSYHTTILGDGKKVQYTPYDQDKNTHTGGGNTNSVGLSVAAAAGASENNVKTPPTSKQLDVLTSETAQIAKGWGWNAATVDKNVRTHGEWERYAVSAGILPPPVQRWDLDRLSNADKFGSGGPKLRDMIKSKLSAMGGGKGNGGPVKKHKVSEFIMGGGKRVLTSGMGMRDFALSPGMHMGVDVSGTTGEPLQAFTDGVVEATGYEANGYGYYVSWIDDKGVGHFYGHMNKPAFVKKGQRVKKGTILGELGSTGRSSGPHLHWEAATNPGDTGRSKSAVLSRFNPLSRYGIDSPFGGSIQPDPSISSSSDSSSSPGPDSSSSSDSSSKEAVYDPNFTIQGGKVKQFYLDALADGSYTGPNVRSIEEETSYEKEGGNNIIMMPMQGSSSPTPVNGRVNKLGASVIGSVNSNMDIYNKSLKQVIVSAFYKI